MTLLPNHYVDLSGAPPTPSKEMPDKPSRELPPAENSTSGPSMEETVPMKSNMNIPMIEEPEQATTVPGPSKEPQLLGKDSPSEEAPNTERKKWNVKIRTWHATNGDTPGRVGVDIVVVSLYNSSMATEERPDADFRLFEPPDADFPQSSDEDREDIPFNDFLYQTQKVFAAESPSPSAPKTPVTLEEDPLADLKVTKGNWLKNPEMLPKYFPNARITTMAYDVYGRGDLPMDISRASEQLREYLSSIKIERPHRHELWQTWDFPVPIVFIGHGYGESIIFQALLGDLSIPELSFDLLKRTAGVLFFSCWFNEWDLPRLLSLPERSKIFRKSVPRSIRRGKLVEAFYKLETAQETKSNMERTHKDGQLKYGSPRSVDLFLHSIFTTVICYHSTKPPCVLDFDNHSINYEWLVDSVKPNMLHFTVNSDHTGLLYFAPIDEAFQRVLDGVQRALTVWGILNEIKNPSAPVQRQQLCLQLGKEVDVDTKDFR